MISSHALLILKHLIRDTSTYRNTCFLTSTYRNTCFFDKYIQKYLFFDKYIQKYLFFDKYIQKYLFFDKYIQKYLSTLCHKVNRYIFRGSNCYFLFHLSF